MLLGPQCLGKRMIMGVMEVIVVTPREVTIL
jgi:hypothetical protein